MKYAVIVSAVAGLALLAPVAFAQSTQSPGASGNPGASFQQTAANTNFYGSSQDDPHKGAEHMSMRDRGHLLERDREEIHNLNAQIAQASTDDERNALRERKREIQNEMVEIQQAN